MVSCTVHQLCICMILTTSTAPVFAKVPPLDEIKRLLHVFFPSMNENTTIYNFLSDEKNVILLERFHETSCMDLKRKRKIRSLDWLWDQFTLPINEAIINGSTFQTPQVYTLNSTEEERYSQEGRFYNPGGIANDDKVNSTDTPTPEVTGTTQWPTDTYRNRVPKQNMRPMDYINLINNDVDAAKGEVAAGGCPFGFGK